MAQSNSDIPESNDSNSNDSEEQDQGNFRQLRKRKIDLSKHIEKKTRQKRLKVNMSANDNAGAQNPGNQNNSGNASSSNPQNQNANQASGSSIFQGLSPNRTEQIKDYVTQQVLQAMSSIRVTTVNPKVDMPEYHYERMTSDTFFTKCVNYFKSQGYQPTQYHQVVAAILKGDMKLWHDNVTSTVNSWDDFCRVFRAKYDSEAVQEKRKRHLYTRRQQFNESVEQFVYEMVNLGRQVNPNESEDTSVDRAYEAMNPDIYRAIGDLHTKTVNNLIEQANRAVRAIKASDKLKGTYTRLPPVYGYKKPDERQGRGRAYSFGSGPPVRRQNEGQSNFQHANAQSTHNTQFRPRVNSAPSTDTKRCYKCNETTHLKKDCPSHGNFQATAMAVSSHSQPHASSSQNTFQNRNRNYSNQSHGQGTSSQAYNNYGRQNQQNPRFNAPSSSQNLNFQGGHRPK